MRPRIYVPVGEFNLRVYAAKKIDKTGRKKIYFPPDDQLV